MSTTIQHKATGAFDGPSHVFGQKSLSSSQYAPNSRPVGDENARWGKSIWSHGSNGAGLGLTTHQPTKDTSEVENKDNPSFPKDHGFDTFGWSDSFQQPLAPRRNGAAPFSTHHEDQSGAASHFRGTTYGSSGHISSTNQPALTVSPTRSFAINDLNRSAVAANSETSTANKPILSPDDYPQPLSSSYNNSRQTQRNCPDPLSVARGDFNVSNHGGARSSKNCSPLDTRTGSYNDPCNGPDRAFLFSSAVSPNWSYGAEFRPQFPLSPHHSVNTQHTVASPGAYSTTLTELGDESCRLRLSDRSNLNNVQSQKLDTMVRYPSVRNPAPSAAPSMPSTAEMQRRPRGQHEPQRITDKRDLNGGPSRPLQNEFATCTISHASNPNTLQRGAAQGRRTPSDTLSNSDRLLAVNNNVRSHPPQATEREYLALNRRSYDPIRTLPSPNRYDQAQYLNDQVQQLMATQLRLQYSRQPHYGMPLDQQASGLPPYLAMQQLSQMSPRSMQPPARPEVGPGMSLRSVLLEEFKSSSGKNSRGWELKDIYDHIVEFSGDQQGSRLIQQKLEQANSEEKERVFRELLPNAIPLMTDVFGNYVIQKFFEHGDQHQKKILAAKMKGQVLSLSLQVYGCRVVQKALEHVLVEEQKSMVRELENQVLKCVKDQNGNHVIQRAIERIPEQHILFIVNAFVGHIGQLSVHTYGCRVVQRLLEWCTEPLKRVFLQEIHSCAQYLIADQYGNYVTQHVIHYGNEDDRSKMIQLVKQNLLAYSKQKFASNVVEKSLVFGTEQDRRDVMLLLCTKDERGVSHLGEMVKDGFGNYVIQRLLDTLPDHDYAAFVEMLAPDVARAQRVMSNSKHIDMIARKMQRLDEPPLIYPNGSNFSLHTLRPDYARVSPPLTSETPRSSTARSSTAPSSTDEILTTSQTDGVTFKGRDCVLPTPKA